MLEPLDGLDDDIAELTLVADQTTCAVAGELEEIVDSDGLPRLLGYLSRYLACELAQLPVVPVPAGESRAHSSSAACLVPRLAMMLAS